MLVSSGMFSTNWRIRTGLLSFLGFVLCLVVLSVLLVPRDLLQSRICALPLQSSELSGICSSIRPYTDPSKSPIAPIVLNSSGSGITFAMSSVHVVSLTRRKDRRSVMERLRKALHLEWQYFDALDKNDAIVDNILHFVAEQRSGINGTFEWPMRDQLRSPFAFAETPVFEFPIDGNTLGANLTSEPLLCATGDNTIPSYANASSVPPYLILSKGMIACWYSHVRLMADIVRRTQDLREDAWDGKEGITTVFEDDIDVEWDLEERIQKIMTELPRDWDIVFLGHCWSDESLNPPLTPGSPLHPSHSPKCTHGYTLSPFGARRLLAHLAYPPFAFSRALDQALAHLVRTHRIRSFSVVPSIVVQRRCALDTSAEECALVAFGGLGDSDIWAGEGQKASRWRDTLEDSALARIANFSGTR
ncbi:hypothetical protein M0805_001320 [Coniferiporia weirii]|nr:hypothetical protein M0805_001320 [Coniferiporia weirii]